MVDDAVIGQTEVDETGTWNFELLLQTTGRYRLRAQALDKVGEVVAGSEPISALRVLPVDVPTLALAGDLELTDNAFRLSGSGTPDSQLRILVNGEPVGLTQVRADGNWAFPILLPDLGLYEITVEALDSGGNPAAAADPVQIRRVLPIVAPTLNVPQRELTAETLALSGSGTPASTIQITVDGEMAGSTQVASDGTWQFEATLPEPGEYTLSAAALDRDGSIAGYSSDVIVNRILPVVEVNVPYWETKDLPKTITSDRITLEGKGVPGTRLQAVVDGEPAGETEIAADGTWTLDARLPGLGLHEIGLETLDSFGNMIASSQQYTINRLPSLEVPTLTLSASETEITTEFLSVTGRGTPESQVRVLVDGEAAGIAQVDEAGQWDLPVFLMALGEHQLTAEALYPDGSVAGASDPLPVTRLLPVVAPTIALVNVDEENETTDDSLAVSGTGTPGSSVQVRVDEVVAGSTRVDDEGNWSLEVPLAELGAYQVTAEALNHREESAGTSNTLTARRIAVVTAPTLALINIDEENETSDEVVTAAGTGTTGSMIRLLVNGEPVGVTGVDIDGNWTFNLPLAETGDYRISAVALDKRGAVAGTSDSTRVRRIPAVVAPTLTLVNVDNANETSDEQADLRGVATPGSTIEVLLDGEIIGTTDVDAAGNWSFAVDLPENATYQFAAQALDKRGDVAGLSETVSATRIPSIVQPTIAATETEVTADTLALNGTGTPGGKIRVLINGEAAGSTAVDVENNWTFEATLSNFGRYLILAEALNKSGQAVTRSDPLIIDRVRPIEPPTLALSNLDDQNQTSAETVVATGSGTPGATIRLLRNGTSAGLTPIDDSGRWTLPLSLPAEGDYQIVAQALNRAGEVAAAAEAISVSRVSAIAAPTLTLADVQASVTQESLTLNGTGTPGSTVEVRLNQEAAGTVEVGQDATWFFTVSLPDLGDYRLSAAALDADGQVAALSNAVSVSRVLPAIAPTLTTAETRLTGEALTLSGTGLPGSTLRLDLDNVAAGSTQVDDEGNWMFEATLIEAGDYAVSAHTLDDDGRAIATSNTLLVTRLPAIAAPTLRAQATQLSDSLLRLSGRGTPGSVIRVLVDGEVAGRTVVDADGRWLLVTLLPDLGEYQISAESPWQSG